MSLWVSGCSFPRDRCVEFVVLIKADDTLTRNRKQSLLCSDTWIGSVTTYLSAKSLSLLQILMVGMNTNSKKYHRKWKKVLSSSRINLDCLYILNYFKVFFSFLCISSLKRRSRRRVLSTYMYMYVNISLLLLLALRAVVWSKVQWPGIAIKGYFRDIVCTRWLLLLPGDVEDGHFMSTLMSMMEPMDGERGVDCSAQHLFLHPFVRTTALGLLPLDVKRERELCCNSADVCTITTTQSALSTWKTFLCRRNILSPIHTGDYNRPFSATVSASCITSICCGFVVPTSRTNASGLVNNTLATTISEQEAQLPQRDSASATHVFLGSLNDRALHWAPDLFYNYIID